MNYKNIFKFLGIAGVALSGLFFTSLIVGIYYGENIIPYGFFVILFFTINYSFVFFLRNHRLNFSIRESVVSVNLLWLLLGVMGGFPLYLYTSCGASGAFFEAISGFTTTGATIFPDIEALPNIILYHRSLMHWIGGVGIVVLGVGLLSVINPSGSLNLYKAESTGLEVEKFSPKLKTTAMKIWGVYAGLTFLNFILLGLFGMGWFDALNHSFSTLSTGGFSTKNSSLGYWDSSAIVWITTIFMIIGGINFIAHLRALNNDLSGYKSEETRWYLIIFFFLATALALEHFFASKDGLFFSATHSFFTIASVMTTTGFASLDYEKWGEMVIATVFIAMLVGGSTGSTAGGVKVIRYVIGIKTIFAEFKRILHPNALISVFIGGKKIREGILITTFGFMVLYFFTVAIVMAYMYARGYDALTSISASLAMVGNIGPGFGQIGPSQNCSFLGEIDKIVLSFAMIIGRLECYTFFLMLTGMFWKKF